MVHVHVSVSALPARMKTVVLVLHVDDPPAGAPANANGEIGVIWEDWDGGLEEEDWLSGCLSHPSGS